MKKLLFALVLGLTLAFAACTSAPKNADQNTTDSTSTVTVDTTCVDSTTMVK